jgi:hypothetical protein
VLALSCLSLNLLFWQDAGKNGTLKYLNIGYENNIFQFSSLFVVRSTD